MTETGIAVRRGLSDGRVLDGRALRVYIPRRRGHRHHQDAFSQALFLAKFMPDLGQQLVWDLAPEVATLVPAECDRIACPPASRRRLVAGFYLARELAVAVCEHLTGDPATGAGGRDVHLCRPLRWTHSEIEGASKASHIVHQGGQGRKLARTAECLEILTGQRVCLVDDLFTTGATAQRCAEALLAARAEAVHLVTLAATERTGARPAESGSGYDGRPTSGRLVEQVESDVLKQRRLNANPLG